jgi:hypothetical protein
MTEQITTDALRALASTGAVDAAIVAAHPDGGYVLSVRVGDSIRTLGSFRGTVRRYAKLDTVATHLAALGIFNIEVDLTELRVEGTTLVTRGRQRRLAI